MIFVFVGPALSGASNVRSPFATESARVVFARAEAALIDYRLDEAEGLYERVARGTDRPEFGRYGLVQVATLRAMMIQEEQAYAPFFHREERLKEHLEQLPESMWRDFLETERLFLVAMVRARRGDYWKAALAGSSAYRGYERLAESEPGLFPAYKGLGVVHALMGAMPDRFRWVLRVLGYSGSIQGGISELQMAAVNSTIGREESVLMFALVDIILNEGRAGGVEALGRLGAERPESLLVSFIQFFVYSQRGDRLESRRALEHALDLAARPGYGEIPFLEFHYGRLLLADNRFEEAAAAFGRYLDSFAGDSYRGEARYRKGLALELAGNREAAVAEYRAVDPPTSFDTDEFARRHARRGLAGPLRPVEREWHLGVNAYDGGRSDEAAERMRRVLATPTATRADSVRARYYQARIAQEAGRKGEARTGFVWVTRAHVDLEERWGPYARYYLAEYLEEEGKTAAARLLYEQVRDEKAEYDFKQSLKQRAKSALERLEREGNG